MEGRSRERKIWEEKRLAAEDDEREEIGEEKGEGVGINSAEEGGREGAREKGDGGWVGGETNPVESTWTKQDLLNLLDRGWFLLVLGVASCLFWSSRQRERVE